MNSKRCPDKSLLFVVDAKTLQASYCLALFQFLKTNDAFAFGIRQNVVYRIKRWLDLASLFSNKSNKFTVVGEPRLGQTHHYMRLDVIGRYHFIANKTFEI